MRRYDLTINGKPYRVQVREFSSEEATLRVNGKTYTVKVNDVLDADASAPAPPAAAASPASAAQPRVQPVSGAAAARAAGTRMITAPIPGAILAIFVKEGDTLTADKVVLKMEAMKMENEIKAETSGTVKSVLVKPGDSVAQGQTLLLIE